MSGDSLIEKWFSAGDAGDLDSFHQFLHPDVIIHAPLGLSTRSVPAEIAVWQDGLEAMPDIRHDIQEVFVSLNSEAARAVVTGTLQKKFGGISPSGQSFTIDQGLFSRVRDGKIIEAWEIVDTMSLMRQLGALPEE